MSRVNNKWVNEESWTFHITNKNLLRSIIDSEDDKELMRVKELEFDEKWLVNDGEGDPPNMDWIRAIIKAWSEEYLDGAPIWLKKFKLVPLIESLYRQDSAYAERIGGVVQWIIYNEKYWQMCDTKQKKVKFVEDCRDWWLEEDHRGRTRNWINKMWTRVLKWYAKKKFWYDSINFMIDYTIEHKGEWQPHPMYDPKVWFPRGRGKINDKVHGGLA